MVRSFSYDANGNATGTSFTWVNPNNPSDVRTVTTTNVYNAGDQQTQTVTPTGTTTGYDILGRGYKTTDPYGGISESIYDARGLVIESKHADGKVSRTVYDAKGRAIYSDDPHRPADATHGTQTIYDDADRVLQTKRLANVVINLIDDPLNPGAKKSVLQSAGAVLSTTSSVYDDAGRVTSTTNADGHVVSYEYDKNGRQTALVEVVNGQTLRTETVYDPANARSALSQNSAAHIVQRLPRETVVYWGAHFDANGPDVGSVNWQTGEVTVWDVKDWRRALPLPKRLSHVGLRMAIRAIETSSLGKTQRDTARQMLRNNTYRVVNVKVSTTRMKFPSVRILR